MERRNEIKKDKRDESNDLRGADLAPVRRNDEEGLNVVFLEEGMALVSEAWLYLVVSVQALQRGPGDVHLAESHKKNTRWKQSCSC